MQLQGSRLPTYAIMQPAFSPSKWKFFPSAKNALVLRLIYEKVGAGSKTKKIGALI